MNIPVPPIDEPQSNPQTCHSYYFYETHHDEKVSDTEKKYRQDKYLSDLYPHLIEISARRQNGRTVGYRYLQSTVKAIMNVVQ